MVEDHGNVCVNFNIVNGEGYVELSQNRLGFIYTMSIPLSKFNGFMFLLKALDDRLKQKYSTEKKKKNVNELSTTHELPIINITNSELPRIIEETKHDFLPEPIFDAELFLQGYNPEQNTPERENDYNAFKISFDKYSNNLPPPTATTPSNLLETETFVLEQTSDENAPEKLKDEFRGLYTNITPEFPDKLKAEKQKSIRDELTNIYCNEICEKITNNLSKLCSGCLCGSKSRSEHKICKLLTRRERIDLVFDQSCGELNDTFIKEKLIEIRPHYKCSLYIKKEDLFKRLSWVRRLKQLIENFF